MFDDKLRTLVFTAAELNRLDTLRVPFGATDPSTGFWSLFIRDTASSDVLEDGRVEVTAQWSRGVVDALDAGLIIADQTNVEEL